MVMLEVRAALLAVVFVTIGGCSDVDRRSGNAARAGSPQTPGGDDCVDGRACGGCGADEATKCGTDLPCSADADCIDKRCDPLTRRCAAPSPDDGVQNGTETDVDCGGTGPAKRCAARRSCKSHGDCESNGCAFDGTCAIAPTCTSLAGGQSCGPNDGLTKQNDCCERAAVGSYTVDKYLVTAGRMRTFLKRLDGKVRDFAAQLPLESWDPSWTPMLPNSLAGVPGDPDNANTQLGPYFDKRSCSSGSFNGHTFWTPLEYGDEAEDFSAEVLDMKALNCVPWWLLAALCAYDGGHLVKEAELRAAYTNDGSTPYPWGARGTYTTGGANDYAIQFYSYATPDPPASARRASDGQFVDIAYYIAPPGRRPLGYNLTGHADLVGNLLEWVGDSERQFVWKASFERHGLDADDALPPHDEDPWMTNDPRPGWGNQPWRWQNMVATAKDPENVNGYYAIGGRCGY